MLSTRLDLAKAQRRPTAGAAHRDPGARHGALWNLRSEPKPG